jgi:hypothetical protein
MMLAFCSINLLAGYPHKLTSSRHRPALSNDHAPELPFFCRRLLQGASFARVICLPHCDVGGIASN